MLEAAKVETSEPVVVNVEQALDAVQAVDELEAVQAVDEIEAEQLDENDKSSPSTLFKTAANRPKLFLSNREKLGITFIGVEIDIWG